MKKIIATSLCLILGAPSFAFGPMGHQPAPPHTMAQHHMTPPPKPHHMHYNRHHMSRGAQTAVAVASVAGLAMIFAAIAD